VQALAVKLGVHSCTGGRPDGWDTTTDGTYPPNPYCFYNPIINGGATQPDPSGVLGYAQSNSWYVSRCRKSQALDAFLFLTLVTFMASLVFDFFGFRKHKSGSHV